MLKAIFNSDLYTNTKVKIIRIQRTQAASAEKGSTISLRLTYIIKAPVCFH